MKTSYASILLRSLEDGKELHLTIQYKAECGGFRASRNVVLGKHQGSSVVCQSDFDIHQSIFYHLKFLLEELDPEISVFKGNVSVCDGLVTKVKIQSGEKIIEISMVNPELSEDERIRTLWRFIRSVCFYDSSLINHFLLFEY